MLNATLFPDLPPPPRRPPDGARPLDDPTCAPRDRPTQRTTSHAIDRLRFENGRRVLTTSVGLRPEEIAELARAARFGPIEVRYRIATPDRRLAAVLDPQAPSPSSRFASLRAARRAGLVAGVVVAPLVPGINAHEADLRRLFHEARRAGAAFVDAEVVLPGDRRRGELAAVLRRLYPRVAARHEVWRRTSDRPPAQERARIELTLAGLRDRFGLPRSREGAFGPPGPDTQRRFAFAM